MLADYAYNLTLISNKVTFIHVGIVVSIYNEQGTSSQSIDENFARDRIKLLRTSLGSGYVLLESLLSWKDEFLGTIVVILKRLLHYRCWKYIQSLWRRAR
jgi:hypothetical protein